MSDPASAGAAGPRSLLRRRDAVAIIVGIVVGAGIYRAPSLVAGGTGDAGWTLCVWVAGGVVSLIGALCYAELASTYPHAGGDYHFLTRAFGRDVSFLYGWGARAVINTGSIALLAFVFGDYAIAHRRRSARIRRRGGPRARRRAAHARQRREPRRRRRARRTG